MSSNESVEALRRGADQVAHNSSRPARRRDALPTAFDWDSYNSFTEAMSSFRRRQLHFVYVTYDHWLSPGNTEVEEYETSLMHAIDDDPEVREPLAKMAFKRFVSHTVEHAAAMKRCAEYAREVSE